MEHEKGDFRAELYERYVSTFKTEQLEADEPALESYWRWCAFKYLPLFAGLPASASFLEVGCGQGRMLEFLKRQGFAAEGIDISEEQIALAQARGLNAKTGDVFEYLQAHPAAYDAIVAIDFVEHFTKAELLRLFPRFYDALKSGGRLILQTPNGQGLFSGQVAYGDLTHLTIFTPDSLRQLLRLTGFSEMTFAETSPAPEGLSGKVRVAIWEVMKRAANFIRQVEGGKGKRQEIWTENLICVARKTSETSA